MAFLSRKRKLEAQPRLEGIRRIPANLAAHPALRDEIEKDCIKYGRSPAFVVWSIVAKHYGFTSQDMPMVWSYRGNPEKRKRGNR